MSLGDRLVAISLPRCTPGLVRAVGVLCELGATPVPLVTRGLESVLSREGIDLSNAIAVDDLCNASTARDQILEVVRERGLHVENWINLADDVTETFLTVIPELLPHLRFDAYRRCRIKCLARQILHDKGLVQTGPVVVDVRTPQYSWEQRSMIAKPITGSGSELVSRLLSAKDWTDYSNAWFHQKLRHGLSDDRLNIFGGFDPYTQVLIEPEFHGLELRADGFVHCGIISICAIAVRVTEATNDGFREIGGASYTMGTRWREFARWVFSVLVALDYHDGVFHLEAIQLPDNTFELIEINPRVGGGGCALVTKRVSGVDLVRENVRIWLGLPPENQPCTTGISSLVYAIAYYNGDGVIRRVAAEHQVDTGMFGRCTWIPFAMQGELVHGSRAEHYLGELHCALSERDVITPDQVRPRVQDGIEWLKQAWLVEVGDLDSNGHAIV